MTTDPQPGLPHRATFTVNVTSRPDGGHYFDRDDFTAHVAGWLKACLKGRHAIAEVTVDESVPSATQIADERRARYAAPLFEIMRGNGWDGERVDREMDLVLDAVIEVADAEQAGLRTAFSNQLDLFAATYDRHTAEIDRLRRMADEKQPMAADTDAAHVAPHCDGFPTTCLNPVTVPPAPPHHGGGIRCGCYDEEQPS